MVEEKPTKARLFDFIAAKPVEPSALKTDISVAPVVPVAPPVPPSAPSAPLVLKAQPTPVSPTPAKAPQNEDVFLTKLFEKKNNEQTSESKLMKGLIETEAKQAEKRSVLGKVPEVDTRLFIDIEYHLKRKLQTVKTSFIIVCVVFGLLAGAAYSTLDSRFAFIFKENIGTKFNLANTNLKNMQTESNRVYYENFKQMLDQLVFIGLDFTQKYNEYQLAPENKKPSVKIDLDEKKKQLADKFDAISTQSMNYKNYRDLAFDKEMSPVEAETYFNQLLRESIANENKLEGLALLPLIENPDANGNKPLADIFKNKKSSDFKTESDFVQMLNNVNEHYKNTLTSYSKIKNARIKWSEYLDEINRIARVADPDYKPELFGSTFSTGVGIKFTGFNIDDNSSIKISGVAITADSTTFTVLAKLLDEFQSSKAFKNPDMRTFFKNVNQQDSKFTSNFSITATLNSEWNSK